jgi:hypothetical protein
MPDNQHNPKNADVPVVSGTPDSGAPSTAASSDFGLGALNQSLAQQDALREQRQLEQQKQALRVDQGQKDMAKIAVAGTQVSQQVVDSMAGLTKVVGENQKAEQEMRDLQTSGNAGDFIQAIGKTISDPQRYTAAGRAKRLAEESNNVQALTAVASAKQNMLSMAAGAVDAQVKAQAGPLNMAQLQETQGNERIQAELARTQTQAQTLATNNQLQEQQLAMMSPADTKAALAKSGGKPIDVGGVIISPGQLQSRVDQLDARQDIADARQAAQETKRLDLNDKLARRELETYSVEELRPMLLNGDPTGKFKLNDIKQVYDTKTAAQTDAIQTAVKAFQFQDFGASTIAPAADEINKIQPNVTPGTPLARQLQQFKSTVGAVANTAEQFRNKETGGYDMPPAVAAASNLAVNDAHDKLMAEVNKQAKQQAKGDKNVEEILNNTLVGNPAPKETVQAAILDRLDNNRPLNDILSDATATKVKQIYTQTYQNLLSQAIANPMANSAESKKLLKEQAQQEAIKQGIGQEITSRTVDLVTNQIDMPDNPLVGQYDKNSFLREVANADSRGRKIFKDTYNLTDEEMARVSQGQAVPDKGVGPEQIANLTTTQNQELFLELDSHQNGLAKKYVDWWGQKGGDYINRVQDARHQEAQKGGIQGLSYESYASEMETQQSQDYVGSLQDSFNNGYDQTKKERYHNLVSFDTRPEYRQAALLQLDSSLTDSEKQKFMGDFLLPAIKDMAAKGGTYTYINDQVEQMIQAGVSNSPEVQKILQKVSKNRTNNVNTLEGILVKPFWNRVALSMTPFASDPESTLERSVSSRREYQWFEDLYKEQK